MGPNEPLPRDLENGVRHSVYFQSTLINLESLHPEFMKISQEDFSQCFPWAFQVSDWLAVSG